ncbi:Cytosolic carboxypeptidase 6, partial [Geodia barretti]
HNGDCLLQEQRGERPTSSTRGALKNPFVGNVSKYVPLPPSEQRAGVKKGRLQFDACFESGNLGRADYVSDYEYDLFIRPDTCNPKFRVWFNFAVSNVRSEQRVIFNIVNFNKTKSLYRDGMSPLVMSTSRPKWQRIPSKSVFYYRCPDHGNNYVLSFAFAFDREEDIYYFSYCYPYTYSRLQQYLERVDALNLPYWKRELLSQSVQQRRLDVVTISSPHNLQTDSHQRMVFITARVHPGETPASYVCQGTVYSSVHTDEDILSGIEESGMRNYVLPQKYSDVLFS